MKKSLTVFELKTSICAHHPLAINRIPMLTSTERLKKFVVISPAISYKADLSPVWNMAGD